MSEIRPDRRRIDATPEPDAEREAADAAREYIACRLRLGRALARIERSRAFHLSACSSVVQYGVRLGIPAAEVRAITDLGHALTATATDLGSAPDPAMRAPWSDGAGAEGVASSGGGPDSLGTTSGVAGPAATGGDPAGAAPVVPGPTRDASGDDGALAAGAGMETSPSAPGTMAGESSGPPAPPPPSQLEAAVLDGRVPVANAALLGKLVAREGLIRPGEDWARRAETLRPSELRRQVITRIEEVAQGAGPLASVTVHITERAREEFHRARVIASREAAFALTEGQTFTRIVRFYLDARDDCRHAPPLRPARVARAEPGEEATAAPQCEPLPPAPPGRRAGAGPNSRYIASESRRAVIERSGDRCEVPGCALDTFLEFAHIESHAQGGDRSAGNLLRLCHVHHTQFDADCLLLAGWQDGRPRFHDARGEPIHPIRPGGAIFPRERAGDVAIAVADRRCRVGQVSDAPPPEYGAESVEAYDTTHPAAYPALRPRRPEPFVAPDDTPASRAVRRHADGSPPTRASPARSVPRSPGRRARIRVRARRMRSRHSSALARACRRRASRDRGRRVRRVWSRAPPRPASGSVSQPSAGWSGRRSAGWASRSVGPSVRWPIGRLAGRPAGRLVHRLADPSARRFADPPVG